MKTKVRLNEGLQFVGTGESGHSVILDGSSDAGGFDSACHPVEMVVISLGGCTGMDIASLLEKMRQNFTDLEIEMEGQRREQHPKVLTDLILTYRVWGEVEEEKFEKAINLSLDKYCSVANTLKPTVSINYDYQINPEVENG
ncbi:MAG: OsmC family protein [Candidatus Bipolaricaulota bacterium]